MNFPASGWSAYRPLTTLAVSLGVLLAMGMLLAIGGCGSSSASNAAKNTSGGDDSGTECADQAKPNIVFILADDMGIGDLQSYNPGSKIPMPHINQLAEDGMRFTDAHAPGSWCTPSRYGLLTGRYPHRDTMRAWTERALIDSGQPTIASLLKRRGYATAMVGKWHLGFAGGTDYDCTRPLEGGPTDHGFDHYFGIPASLDIPPYFFIRDGRCAGAPTREVAGSQSEEAIWTDIQGAFWRAGKAAPGFRHDEVLPRLQKEATSYLEAHRRKDTEQPFFLYLALTAPHTPWLPPDSLRGQSGAGLYGDFAVQVDGVVGEVLKALGRLGMKENTVVVFTSDNGPVWYPKDEKRFSHRSAFIYRGMKGDAWEGGHRMPFIARWPGRIKAGAVSDALLSFTDLRATFEALTATADHPARGGGSDSYNLLPVLLGKTPEEPLREGMVHYTSTYLAVRQGPWKLIPGLGSGGFTKPRRRAPGPGEPPGQLYNLAEDPSEQHNVYDEHPEVARRLSALLERYKKEARAEGEARSEGEAR